MLFAGVLEITGVTLAIVALKYRTPEHPEIPSWNPRNWRPIWTVRSWYTPRGFKMQLIGWTMFTVGVAIDLVLVYAK